MTRREHFQQLADELGAHVLPAKSFRESYSAYYLGQVSVNLDTEAGYWAALHELGHYALQHRGKAWAIKRARGRQSGVSAAEAEAWAWALDHADGELTEDGRAALAYGLGSYTAAFGAPPGHADFARVFAEARGGDLSRLVGEVEFFQLATAAEAYDSVPTEAVAA